MSRTLRPLAALAMIALISAGCSNTPAETGTGSSGGNTNAANHQKAVKFAECMRDNGVREFPDPDASGEFRYGIKRGSSLDPSTAAWKKAIGACKDLQPPGLMGGKVSAQEQEARLKFAQCMRDNGVKDFPDPTKNGPLIDVEGARSKPRRCPSGSAASYTSGTAPTLAAGGSSGPESSINGSIPTAYWSACKSTRTIRPKGADQQELPRAL